MGYLAVCVPIVVICAPLGSLIASHFHRLVLAGLIYFLEVVALITGFHIRLDLAVVSASIIVGGFLFFFVLSKIGIKLCYDMDAEVAAGKNETPIPTVAYCNEHKEENRRKAKSKA